MYCRQAVRVLSANVIALFMLFGRFLEGRFQILNNLSGLYFLLKLFFFHWLLNATFCTNIVSTGYEDDNNTDIHMNRPGVKY